MNRSRQIVAFVFIVGFILGFFVALGLLSKRDIDSGTFYSDNLLENGDEVREKELVNPTHTNPTLIAEDNLVHVKDQKAGEGVFLSRVELTQNGWAAVRELANGTPGNILGARRFDVGVHQTTISLLRHTKPGSMYEVVLYADNGDKTFDFGTDSLITDKSGNPISMSFEAY